MAFGESPTSFQATTGRSGEDDAALCQICMCQRPFSSGLLCNGDGRHFTCRDCFMQYVSSCCAPHNAPKFRRHGCIIYCPGRPCTAAAPAAAADQQQTHDLGFTDRQIMGHVDDQCWAAFEGARQQAYIAQGFSQAMALASATQQAEHQPQHHHDQQQQTEHEELVSRLRNGVINTALTLVPPCCQHAAVLDFDGCLALLCDHCGQHFCGLCMEQHGDSLDVHMHARQCRLRQEGSARDHGYFAPEEEVAAARRQLFTERLDAAFQQHRGRPALLAALVRAMGRDLRDLGIDPGRWLGGGPQPAAAPVPPPPVAPVILVPAVQAGLAAQRGRAGAGAIGIQPALPQPDGDDDDDEFDMLEPPVAELQELGQAWRYWQQVQQAAAELLQLELDHPAGQAAAAGRQRDENDEEIVAVRDVRWVQPDEQWWQHYDNQQRQQHQQGRPLALDDPGGQAAAAGPHDAYDLQIVGDVGVVVQWALPDEQLQQLYNLQRQHQHYEQAGRRLGLGLMPPQHHQEQQQQQEQEQEEGEEEEEEEGGTMLHLGQLLRQDPLRALGMMTPAQQARAQELADLQVRRRQLRLRQHELMQQLQEGSARHERDLARLADLEQQQREADQQEQAVWLQAWQQQQERRQMWWQGDPLLHRLGMQQHVRAREEQGRRWRREAQRREALHMQALQRVQQAWWALRDTLQQEVEGVRQQRREVRRRRQQLQEEMG